MTMITDKKIGPPHKGGVVAIIVITDEQHSVVTALERAIDAGVVKDWTYEGNDFVLNSDPAAGARFRPAFDKGAVLFGMLAAPGVPITPFNYARLHACFLQLLLEHADRLFDAAEITALPCDYDVTHHPKAGRLPASTDEEEDHSACPERACDMTFPTC
jgi:hypothetical protein